MSRIDEETSYILSRIISLPAHKAGRKGRKIFV